MEVQVSSLTQESGYPSLQPHFFHLWTLLFFPHSSSCNLKVSKPATPLSSYVSLTPRRAKLLPPHQSWHFSSHQAEEIWSLLHLPSTPSPHQHCRKTSAFFLHTSLSCPPTPLQHPDTPTCRDEIIQDWSSFLVREKKGQQLPRKVPLVDPTLSTKEMEVEKDEQIVVVLEREARGGRRPNWITWWKVEGRKTENWVISKIVFSWKSTVATGHRAP